MNEKGDLYLNIVPWQQCYGFKVIFLLSASMDFQ